MLFSQKLKNIMQERKITTYSIQKATGISQGNVDSWLKGKSKPRSANLNKLCTYLGVPVDYFTSEPPRDAKHTLHKKITKRQIANLRTSICDMVNTKVSTSDLVLLERIVKTFVE